MTDRPYDANVPALSRLVSGWRCGQSSFLASHEFMEDRAAMPESTFLVFEASGDPGRATLAVDVGNRSPHAVSPLLFAKFCEHLGYNIYHGMEAQILYNPTFGKIRVDEGSIRRLAERLGWPSAEPVIDAYADGAALGWFRVGGKDQVLLSPDAGPYGKQAQRFETPGATTAAPLGIG
jgi:alpha-N-arabinofuranosidase